MLQKKFSFHFQWYFLIHFFQLSIVRRKVKYVNDDFKIYNEKLINELITKTLRFLARFKKKGNIPLWTFPNRNKSSPWNLSSRDCSKTSVGCSMFVSYFSTSSTAIRHNWKWKVCFVFHYFVWKQWFCCFYLNVYFLHWIFNIITDTTNPLTAGTNCQRSCDANND